MCSMVISSDPQDFRDPDNPEGDCTDGYHAEHHDPDRPLGRRQEGRRDPQRQRAQALAPPPRRPPRPAPSTARTPVDYATEYAEKAVLIPLGASLVARDRVIETVSDLSDLHGSRQGREGPAQRRSRRAAQVRAPRPHGPQPLRARGAQEPHEGRAHAAHASQPRRARDQGVPPRPRQAGDVDPQERRHAGRDRQTRVEALVKDLQAEFTKRVQSVA